MGEEGRQGRMQGGTEAGKEGGNVSPRGELEWNEMKTRRTTNIHKQTRRKTEHETATQPASHTSGTEFLKEKWCIWNRQ